MTKKFGISAAVLKWTAAFTMLVDHFGASVVMREMYDGPYYIPYGFYNALRLIGRLAFPIFCFLITESFFHTRSKPKMVVRLFIFALVSEVPFDMTIRNSFWDTAYNNVILTLFIAFLTIWGMEELKTRLPMDKWLIRGILMGLTGMAGALTAHFLNTDYGAVGVATVIIFYALHDHPVIAMTLAVILLAVGSWEGELAALCNLPLVYFYNGERGRQPKYFFYAFYPGHLAVLALICYLLGMGI